MALNLQPARSNGKWKPGQSGNPAGERRDRTLQELCRCHTEQAVKALIVALRNPRERVPAAIALLDRGWGKPQQNVHVQSESTVLHLIAAQAFGVELQQQAPVIEHTEQPADDMPRE